jgi:hypothetical protein
VVTSQQQQQQHDGNKLITLLHPLTSEPYAALLSILMISSAPCFDTWPAGVRTSFCSA